MDIHIWTLYRESVCMCTLKPWFMKGTQHYKKTIVFLVVGHITGLDIRESVHLYARKPWFVKGSQHYRKTMVFFMVGQKTGSDIRESVDNIH